MQRYILKRLLFSIPVVFLVTVILFLLVNALPGDVIENQAAGYMTKEQIQKYKEDVGLNRPVLTRYFDWLGNTVQADLGKSLYNGRQVKDELAQRLPATLELGLASLVLATLIAIPLGIISAIRANTPLDYVARFLAIWGLATPEFLLAVLVILLLSKYLGFFPGVGYVPFWEDPIQNLRLMWLPILLLGVSSSASIARMTRSTLLEVLHSDYIRTAWAKGLRERVVVVRHALKNALIPVVTILGLRVSHVIGGVVIIETLFTLPGMGSMLAEAIFQRDFVPLQSLVLIFALVVVVVNLLVDLSYSWLDPRIRQT